VISCRKRSRSWASFDAHLFSFISLSPSRLGRTLILGNGRPTNFADEVRRAFPWSGSRWSISRSFGAESMHRGAPLGCRALCRGALDDDARLSFLSS